MTRIISAILIISFLAYDITWACPDALQIELKTTKDDFKDAFGTKYLVDRAKQISAFIESHPHDSLEEIARWDKASDRCFDDTSFHITRAFGGAREIRIEIYRPGDAERKDAVVLRYCAVEGGARALPDGCVEASYFGLNRSFGGKNFHRQLFLTASLHTKLVRTTKALSPPAGAKDAASGDPASVFPAMQRFKTLDALLVSGSLSRKGVLERISDRLTALFDGLANYKKDGYYAYAITNFIQLYSSRIGGAIEKGSGVIDKGVLEGAMRAVDRISQRRETTQGEARKLIRIRQAFEEADHLVEAIYDSLDKIAESGAAFDAWLANASAEEKSAYYFTAAKETLWRFSRICEFFRENGAAYIPEDFSLPSYEERLNEYYQDYLEWFVSDSEDIRRGDCIKMAKTLRAAAVDVVVGEGAQKQAAALADRLTALVKLHDDLHGIEPAQAGGRMPGLLMSTGIGGFLTIALTGCSAAGGGDGFFVALGVGVALCAAAVYYLLRPGSPTHEKLWQGARSAFTRFLMRFKFFRKYAEIDELRKTVLRQIEGSDGKPNQYDLKKWVFSNWLLVRQVMSGNRHNLPLYIEIHPTDMCNSRCIWCEHRKGSVGQNKLSRETMLALIEDIHKHGMNPLIRFSGFKGEPLINDPATIDAVAKAIGYGMKVGLTTNGIRLDEAMFSVLMKADFVNISLDAVDEETNRSLRGEPEGNWAKKIDALGKFVAYKKAHGGTVNINASFIMQPETFERLPDVARELKKIGVDKVIVKVAHFDSKSGIMTVEEVKRAFTILEEAKRQLNDKAFRLVTNQTEEETVAKMTALLPKPIFKRCFAAIFGVAVDPLGMLWPCCHYGYRTFALGVKASEEVGSFSEAWFGERRRGSIETGDPRESCDYCAPVDAEENRLFEDLDAGYAIDIGLLSYVRAQFAGDPVVARAYENDRAMVGRLNPYTGGILLRTLYALGIYNLRDVIHAISAEQRSVGRVKKEIESSENRQPIGKIDVHYNPHLDHEVKARGVAVSMKGIHAIYMIPRMVVRAILRFFRRGARGDCQLCALDPAATVFKWHRRWSILMAPWPHTDADHCSIVFNRHADQDLDRSDIGDMIDYVCDTPGAHVGFNGKGAGDRIGHKSFQDYSVAQGIEEYAASVLGDFPSAEVGELTDEDIQIFRVKSPDRRFAAGLVWDAVSAIKELGLAYNLYAHLNKKDGDICVFVVPRTNESSTVFNQRHGIAEISRNFVLTKEEGFARVDLGKVTQKEAEDAIRQALIEIGLARTDERSASLRARLISKAQGLAANGTKGAAGAVGVAPQATETSGPSGAEVYRERYFKKAVEVFGEGAMSGVGDLDTEYQGRVEEMRWSMVKGAYESGALDTAGHDTIRLPEKLTVLTTDRCTRKCAFCVSDASPQGKTDIARGDLNRALNQIWHKNLRMPRVLLTGGESLKHPEIMRLIDESGEFIAGLFTNADFAVDEESAKKVVKEVRDNLGKWGWDFERFQFNISLDSLHGDPDEAITRVANSIEAIWSYFPEAGVFISCQRVDQLQDGSNPLLEKLFDRLAPERDGGIDIAGGVILTGKRNISGHTTVAFDEFSFIDLDMIGSEDLYINKTIRVRHYPLIFQNRGFLALGDGSYKTDAYDPAPTALHDSSVFTPKSLDTLYISPDGIIGSVDALVDNPKPLRLGTIADPDVAETVSDHLNRDPLARLSHSEGGPGRILRLSAEYDTEFTDRLLRTPLFAMDRAHDSREMALDMSWPQIFYWVTLDPARRLYITMRLLQEEASQHPGGTDGDIVKGLVKVDTPPEAVKVAALQLVKGLAAPASAVAEGKLLTTGHPANSHSHRSGQALMNVESVIFTSHYKYDMGGEASREIAMFAYKILTELDITIDIKTRKGIVRADDWDSIRNADFSRNEKVTLIAKGHHASADLQKMLDLMKRVMDLAVDIREPGMGAHENELNVARQANTEIKGKIDALIAELVAKIALIKGTTAAGQGQIARCATAEDASLIAKRLEKQTRIALQLGDRLRDLEEHVSGISSSVIPDDMKDAISSQIRRALGVDYVEFDAIVLEDQADPMTARGWLFGFNTMPRAPDAISDSTDETFLQRSIAELYPQAAIGLSGQILRAIESEKDPALRNSLYQEYLFHEVCCPLFGHHQARELQEIIFAGNYLEVTGDTTPGHKDGALARIIQRVRAEALARLAGAARDGLRLVDVSLDLAGIAGWNPDDEIDAVILVSDNTGTLTKATYEPIAGEMLDGLVRLASQEENALLVNTGDSYDDTRLSQKTVLDTLASSGIADRYQLIGGSGKMAVGYNPDGSVARKEVADDWPLTTRIRYGQALIDAFFSRLETMVVDPSGAFKTALAGITASDIRQARDSAVRRFEDIVQAGRWGLDDAGVPVTKYVFPLLTGELADRLAGPYIYDIGTALCLELQDTRKLFDKISPKQKDTLHFSIAVEAALWKAMPGERELYILSGGTFVYLSKFTKALAVAPKLDELIAAIPRDKKVLVAIMGDGRNDIPTFKLDLARHPNVRALSFYLNHVEDDAGLLPEGAFVTNGELLDGGFSVIQWLNRLRGRKLKDTPKFAVKKWRTVEPEAGTDAAAKELMKTEKGFWIYDVSSARLARGPDSVPVQSQDCARIEPGRKYEAILVSCAAIYIFNKAGETVGMKHFYTGHQNEVTEEFFGPIEDLISPDNYYLITPGLSGLNEEGGPFIARVADHLAGKGIPREHMYSHESAHYAALLQREGFHRVLVTASRDGGVRLDFYDGGRDFSEGPYASEVIERPAGATGSGDAKPAKIRVEDRQSLEEAYEKIREATAAMVEAGLVPQPAENPPVYDVSLVASIPALDENIAGKLGGIVHNVEWISPAISWVPHNELHTTLGSIVTNVPPDEVNGSTPRADAAMAETVRQIMREAGPLAIHFHGISIGPDGSIFVEGHLTDDALFALRKSLAGAYPDARRGTPLVHITLGRVTGPITPEEFKALYNHVALLQMEVIGSVEVTEADLVTTGDMFGTDRVGPAVTIRMKDVFDEKLQAGPDEEIRDMIAAASQAPTTAATLVPKKTGNGFQVFDSSERAPINVDVLEIEDGASVPVAQDREYRLSLSACVGLVIFDASGRPVGAAHFMPATTGSIANVLTNVERLIKPGNRYLIIPGAEAEIERARYQAPFIARLAEHLRREGVPSDLMYVHDSDYYNVSGGADADPGVYAHIAQEKGVRLDFVRDVFGTSVPRRDRIIGCEVIRAAKDASPAQRGIPDAGRADEDLFDEMESFLGTMHQSVIAQLKEIANSPAERRILISEELMDPEDTDVNFLRGILKAAHIEILPARDIMAASKREGTARHNVACIISRAEYERLWGGDDHVNNKASVIILDEDLRQKRYLCLQGMIGFAYAVMSGNETRMHAYADILFDDETLDIDVLVRALKDGDLATLAHRISLKFKTIPFDVEKLREYKLLMEDYIRRMA